MDLSTVGTTFKDISTGLLGIGVGLNVLTLAAGGIAMYFSWLTPTSADSSKRCCCRCWPATTCSGCRAHWGCGSAASSA